MTSLARRVGKPLYRAHAPAAIRTPCVGEGGGGAVVIYRESAFARLLGVNDRPRLERQRVRGVQEKEREREREAGSY